MLEDRKGYGEKPALGIGSAVMAVRASFRDTVGVHTHRLFFHVPWGILLRVPSVGLRGL